MKTSHLILLCAVVLIIIAAISAYFVMDSYNLETHFVVGDTNISSSSHFKMALHDEKNNPLSGCDVEVVLKDSDDKSTTYKLKTDDKGIAEIPDELSQGDYLVSAVYNGGDGYKSCSFDNLHLTVFKEKAVESSSKSVNSNDDPYYEAGWDDDHQDATVDNPVTVTKPDGDTYTYYGPGHYDYYAGGNHMSGEYYKQRNG